MSIFYTLKNYPKVHESDLIGKARLNPKMLSSNVHLHGLTNNFDEVVLFYLDEKILNHLIDSLSLQAEAPRFRGSFSDYSFFTAPAYKAFEGFLFQLARDLKLPSTGKIEFIGTYFDEAKVSQAIDDAINEIESKADLEARLTKDEKQFIKDMVSKMKRFLVHYRHTPAHFQGKPIDTVDKANQNISSIYQMINETTTTLLKPGLISVIDDLH